ncbi:unnamed protein product [Calypogeia fissa]
MQVKQLLHSVLVQPYCAIRDKIQKPLTLTIKPSGKRPEVHINIDTHCDLRHTTWSRRDSRQLELPEQIVVSHPRSLTLIYLDQHTRHSILS